MSRSGFTLIEVLVALAIVAILSVVSITMVSGFIAKARTNTTQALVNDAVKSIYRIKSMSGKSSMAITGSGCSECACRDGNPTDQNTTCVTNWRTALNNFAATGKEWGLPNMNDYTKDAWGSPLMLDENEGENGNCNRDSLFSPGADRIRGTSDDVLPTYQILNVTQACPQ